MSHEVFISYSSKDKETADRVCAALEESGTVCWIAPRDVMPGRPYGAALIDAINQCTVMVLLLSEYSNHSQQVVREVERATSKAVPIIPLRLEEVTLNKSLEYFLSTCHWLDAMDGPTDRHLHALTEAVNQTLRNIYNNETLQFGGGTRGKPGPTKNRQEVILAEPVDTEDQVAHYDRRSGHDRRQSHDRRRTPAHRPVPQGIPAGHQAAAGPYQSPQRPGPRQSAARPAGRANVMGIVGLTTSLLSVFTCFMLSPFGFLFSLLGLLQAPRGSAIGGAIFGAIGTTILAVMFGYGFYGGFTTTTNLEATADRIHAYQIENGLAPDQELGDSLIAEETDAWNNPLIYEPFEDRSGFEIRSAGLDGDFYTSDDHTTFR